MRKTDLLKCFMGKIEMSMTPDRQKKLANFNC